MAAEEKETLEEEKLTMEIGNENLCKWTRV
jgi:hypothetical protein